MKDTGKPKRRTTAPPGVILRAYTMRNMRLDFLDRIRVCAALHRTPTLEQEVLNVIERGLKVREKEAHPEPGTGSMDYRGAGYRQPAR